jgi:diguanylate cyclase (GGDEF)-like protein/PAS domain S-box-containing protein
LLPTQSSVIVSNLAAGRVTQSPNRLLSGVFAAVAVGFAAVVAWTGWPAPDRLFDFPVLMTAAVGASFITLRRPSAKVVMQPSFVIELASLLLVGASAATLVAAAGLVMERLTKPRQSTIVTLVRVAGATVGLQVAGLVHRALHGAVGDFRWPAQALPIAAATLLYCLIVGLITAVAEPIARKQAVSRSWWKEILSGVQPLVVGAFAAIGGAALIDQRAWELLLVSSVPMVFAYRIYKVHVDRLWEDEHHRAIANASGHGMCILDDEGQITLWSDAAERILECPRERALGKPLIAAVRALEKTALPKAIIEAQSTQSVKTLPDIVLRTENPRVLEVRIVPTSGGVTLLWHDITERVRVERGLKRHQERLALAIEGANDGLWEWDVRTHEFYFSSRWLSMLGQDGPARIGRPDEWLKRVHKDDITGLHKAIELCLSGANEQLSHEHRIAHENGTYRRFLLRGVAVRGAGRRPIRMAGSLTDTTEQAIVRERLQTAGFLDPLTGLCNRAVFVEGLGRRLAEFKERPRTRFAVLYLDLDRFKIVNDSLGHLVGDELLTAVSRRLESCLREGDTLARLGGDEFVILLNELAEQQQANAIAFRIQDALSAPYSIGGREVFTSVSMGIAFGRAEYKDPDEIMRDADIAMYHAKSHGKARHEVFDADMHARAQDRLGLENDLRRAVQHNQFEVHYQPIVSLNSGLCVGFESLIRWTRDGESVSPAIFIPIAEELGLVDRIGTWVLAEACQTFAEWRRRYAEAGLECITVNVSSRQLMQQNFLALVEQAVHQSGLQPCELRLEITETALMDNPTTAAQVLQALRDFGVKIYLDDFGTGFSSLSHLHRLPVDALKIDRSFVRSLLLPDRPAIVESILALGRTLNTSVVAEGVESDVQWKELERLGCKRAQGFLFSRPVSAAAAEKIVAARQPLGLKSNAGPVEAKDAWLGVGPFEWPANTTSSPMRSC